MFILAVSQTPKTRGVLNPPKKPQHFFGEERHPPSLRSLPKNLAGLWCQCALQANSTRLFHAGSPTRWGCPKVVDDDLLRCRKGGTRMELGVFFKHLS